MLIITSENNKEIKKMRRDVNEVIQLQFYHSVYSNSLKRFSIAGCPIITSTTRSVCCNLYLYILNEYRASADTCAKSPLAFFYIYLMFFSFKKNASFLFFFLFN